MIGTTKDLFVGAFFRETFEGDWLRVGDLKVGKEGTQVKIGGRWRTIKNDIGIQIAVKPKGGK